MRPGTPGFEGSRLREAREARGFTASLLAELVGVSPQAVSKWEHGDTSPSPKTLEDVSEKLSLPLAFFTHPVGAEVDETIFFRSMSAATKRARTRASRKLEWLEEMGSYLGEHVTFPEVNLPDLRLPGDPLMISDDDVENAAEDARRFWRMSDAPIGNTVRLVENQGVIVARHPLGADSLDSLSAMSARAQRPFIIVGTDRGTAARWRFDVAHELGHLLLHRDVEQKTLRNSPIFKRVEEQAHRFAAAFLVPLEAFRDDLFALSLDAMRAMKPKWKVSIAMMIVRARHAGLLTEESERRLWIGLGRRGWRRAEPYDDMPPEEPRLLSRAIELALESGELTTDDLVAGLRFSASDIEGLAGLTPGFLTGDFTPVRISVQRDQSRGNPNKPPADVVPLRPRRRQP